IVDRFRTAVMDARLCDLYARYQDREDMLVDSLAELYTSIIGNNLGKLLEAINIEKIVVDKINAFDAAQLEGMIFGIMKRELKAIVYLGALLGFLMGFVNLLLLIGIAASCAVWLFALIALCCHVCPVTIVCFVLATLILIFYGLILWCEWAKSKKAKGGEKANPKADEESPATATDNRDQETDAIPAAAPVVGTSGENDIVSMDDADEEDEEGGVVVDAKGNYFNIRYSKSFLAKLIQSPDETKGYYGELKNEVLSYKKTKSRVSWSYDSVNAGRAPVVKFGIRGKTLCVYFALNADDYADSKYKVEKVESKKYEAVPCMYRIKNERRLGYAKDLIAAVAAQLGLTKGIVGTEDYYLPYESTEALIGKGLIKELKLAATTTQIERAKAEGTIKVVAHVEASEVNALISDEVAAAAIQVADTKSVHTGKKGIINVDTLSLHFADGDTVTIEKLKAMKLIPAKYGQVKLLARGRLDKKLYIELQDYSIDAVKMVLLTGGTVKRV
ncbi:MAG: uL15 family ribosomal protein, partial [Clostridia bacterium]|nr:uL15 family ribosomal protein [Clostridia bacterium]